MKGDWVGFNRKGGRVLFKCSVYFFWKGKIGLKLFFIVVVHQLMDYKIAIIIESPLLSLRFLTVKASAVLATNCSDDLVIVIPKDF